MMDRIEIITERINLYITNLKAKKNSLEFQIQELVNSDVLFSEFENKMDIILLDIYNIDTKINLLTEYLKPITNDSV